MITDRDSWQLFSDAGEGMLEDWIKPCVRTSHNIAS
jgi:hypothetical protein